MVLATFIIDTHGIVNLLVNELSKVAEGWSYTVHVYGGVSERG